MAVLRRVDHEAEWLGAADVGRRAAVEVAIAHVELDEPHAERQKGLLERGDIEEARHDAPRCADVDGRDVAAGHGVVDIRLQKHLVAGNGPGEPSADQLVDELRRETQSGALARQHGAGDGRVRGNVRGGDQALAEHSSVQRLAARNPAMRHADRRLDFADRTHLLRELRRLEAGLVVRPAHRAVQCEVAFQKPRAHGDGGERDRGAVVVSGVADGPA